MFISMFACAVPVNKVVFLLPLQVHREALSCTETLCLVSRVFRERGSDQEAARSFLQL